jgi:RHS repeat-associated protein
MPSRLTGYFYAKKWAYRYSFNGQEKDDEVSGDGNSIAYELRIYDPRLGRFSSIDPRTSEYPWQSTYAYFKNCPIITLDYKGGGGENSGEEEDSPGMMDDGKKNGGSLIGKIADQGNSSLPERSKGSSETLAVEEKPQGGILTPTRPSEINLRKIGDAYYTNITYEENFYDLQNGPLRLRTAEVSIPSLNVMVKSRTSTGRYRSMDEVKTELAIIITKTRYDAGNRWLEGNLLSSKQVADYIVKDLEISISLAFGYPSTAQERTPRRWLGAPKSNLIYLLP